MAPENPYIAGNPVGNTSAFVGRHDVLEAVLRILRHPNQNAIVLYGQRRIGKTSVLQYLNARLPEEGPFRPVYFDLQDKAVWRLSRVLEDLAAVISHTLNRPVPDLGDDPEAAFHKDWLPKVLDNLWETESLVLLFDEFDELTDPSAQQAAATFFPYLRTLLNIDVHRLQFVFVLGRNIDDLSTIAPSLFKSTEARRVSLLDKEDTVKLVQLSQKDNSLAWPDQAVERVWELTHGHPFLTQQLCSYVWERVHLVDTTSTPTVSPEDVDSAIPTTLDASLNTLKWLWDGLPPAERVVISVLAETGPDAITKDQLEEVLRESGVRVLIRELQNAPQLLQDWDLIEPVDGGFRFRVELLRRWLVDHKPLSRVQDELDRIVPVAENLYLAAWGLYQGGELGQAKELLNQAVGLNPNHLRANELLAEISLSQGDVDKAQEILERLFEYHPAAARPRLVQTYLAKAQDNQDETQVLTLYERILELDPSQPEALAARMHFWEKQLSEFEAEKRYIEAFEIGQKLAESYPDARNWQNELGRLYQKTQLSDLYQRAIKAINDGKTAEALELLVEVVQLEPAYEHATAYLHQSVTGEDIFELREQIGKYASEMEAYQEAWKTAKTIESKYAIYPGTIPQSAKMRLGWGTINASALSPNGDILAIASSTGIFLYAVQTFSLIWHHSTGAWVNCIAFSPDGEKIAGGSSEGALRLLDVSSGEVLNEMPGHERVFSIDFSPDGNSLAAGYGDGIILLWDIASGERIRSLPGHSDSVNSLSFSSEGNILASGSADGGIYLINPSSGDKNRTLTGHAGKIHRVLFSPHAEILASCSGDGTVILWDTTSGEQIRTFSGHTSRVFSTAFSPDGSMLASGSGDGAIILWEAATGNQRSALAGHKFWVHSLAFTSDGGGLVSSSWDGTAIHWDINSNKRIRTLFGHSNSVLCTAFSPRNGLLASGTWDGAVFLWDADEGSRLHSLYGHKGNVSSVAFSASGELLASGSDDNEIILWDTKSGRQLRSLSGHTNRVFSVAFSSIHPMLASGSGDGSVIIWDISSGKQIRNIPGHPGKVYDVEFSPDGLTIASGTGDGNVTLWNAASGEYIRALAGHSSRIFGVAFAPDGQILASGSGDGSIIIWDVMTGEIKQTISAHSSNVLSLQFSKDGNILASGANDGVVSLWDSSTGNQAVTLKGHTSSVNSVSFSPNGSTMASGSGDGTIILWEVG